MEKNHHNSFLTTGKSCRSNVCRPHLIGQFQNFKDQRLVLATQDCGRKKWAWGAIRVGWGWIQVFLHWWWVCTCMGSSWDFLIWDFWPWCVYGCPLNFQDCRTPSLGRWCLQSSSQDRCHEWTWVVTDPFHVVACKRVEDMLIYFVFLKYHMRAIAHHAFIRAMGYPTFDQPCARPDTCPSTKKMQHLPNLPQSIYIYIYTHIFIYK